MTFHRLAAAALLAAGFVAVAPLAAQQAPPPTDQGAAEVAQLRDRAAWAKRMAQKGYLTVAQAQEDEARLKAAETRLARQAAGDPATKTAPAPEKAAPAAPKWEYKILEVMDITKFGNKNLGAELNKLGDEGWDLVTVIQSGSTTFYFKRPKARAAGEEAKPGAAKAENKNEDYEILRLKNVSAVDFAKTADALFSGEGGGGPRLVAEPVTNAVLANGTPKQIEELRRLIAALDVADAAVGAAEVVPHLEMLQLKYAKVADVVKLLQELYGKEAKTFRVGSDERTNALVLYGSQKMLEDVKALVSRLDVPAPKDGDRKNP